MPRGSVPCGELADARAVARLADIVSYRAEAMAYVIGIVSQKGGAGKSTLVRQLACELAHNAMRVKILERQRQQNHPRHRDRPRPRYDQTSGTSRARGVGRAGPRWRPNAETRRYDRQRHELRGRARMTDNATSFAAALTSTSEQRGRRYRNESNIKVDLSQLIGVLWYGPVETEHPIPGGSIDIYVPHHRVIIETKARGLAADPHKPQGADRESPKEQLDRYVLSGIRTELSSFDWDPEDRSKQPWVGVVTDGTIWHSWRYPHEENPEVETIQARTTSNAGALIAALTAAFGTERTGKPWVPAEPADLFRDHEKALGSLYRQLPRAVRTRTETKRQLWLDMLRVSGIAPHDNDADRLFVTHSLLIAIARLVAHGLTRDREDWRAALDDGFVSWISDSHPGRE